MKPSEVFIGVPPLCDTMGRCEAECAAALMVLGCQHHGDQWQPLEPKQIGTAIQAALDEKREPWATLNTNPFCRPDFWDLVKRGFARWENDPGGAVSFTMWGLLRLERWAKTEPVEPLQVACGIAFDYGRLRGVSMDAFAVVDDWLGHASTRAAAEDSLWRLRRLLDSQGELRHRDHLTWRLTLFRNLDEAIAERDELALRWRMLARACSLLQDSLGEYVRQSLHANPEWRSGIQAVEAALAKSLPEPKPTAPLFAVQLGLKRPHQGRGDPVVVPLEEAGPGEHLVSDGHALFWLSANGRLHHLAVPLEDTVGIQRSVYWHEPPRRKP